jgi:hypothetical protein
MLNLSTVRDAFVQRIAALRKMATISFRYLPPEAKEESITNAVAHDRGCHEVRFAAENQHGYPIRHASEINHRLPGIDQLFYLRKTSAIYAWPNWITKPPATMSPNPSHVAMGTVSLKANRPQRTLTVAKTATYTPRSFEKSHFTVFTTSP